MKDPRFEGGRREARNGMILFWLLIAAGLALAIYIATR